MIIFIASIILILLETNLNSYKKYCENKDFCNICLPSKDTKILELNQYHESDKVHLLSLQILNVF